MKAKQGNGRFQWNAGGWFGGLVGSTVWLFILAGETFQKSPRAAMWLTFCAAAPNALGYILWMRRDRLAPHPALQFLIAGIGLFSILALLIADYSHVLPIIDSRFMTSPRQGYWVMLIFPFLMAQFALMERASVKRNKTMNAQRGAPPNRDLPFVARHT